LALSSTVSVLTPLSEVTNTRQGVMNALTISPNKPGKVKAKASEPVDGIVVEVMVGEIKEDN